MHEQFASLATRLIARNGRTVHLVTKSGNSFDPDNDAEGEPVAVLAVQTNYKATEVDGDLVQSSDKKFLIDSQVEVTSNMAIRDGDDSYSIVDVDLIQPGTTSIMYKVQARS